VGKGKAHSMRGGYEFSDGGCDLKMGHAIASVYCPYAGRMKGWSLRRKRLLCGLEKGGEGFVGEVVLSVREEDH